MADDPLLEKVHDLSDIELALLLCLATREHGIISTPASTLDDVVVEVRLAASNTFGLTCSVVDCNEDTTLEDFTAGLLYPPARPASSASSRRKSSAASTPSSDSYFSLQRQKHRNPSIAPLTTISGPGSGIGSETPIAQRQIASCVIARNLDLAPRLVQIQALELLRTRRIFTHTTVHAAPRNFVFLPVLEASRAGDARLTHHLNDFLSLAHWHDPDDGFVNLEEAEQRGLGLVAPPSTTPVISMGDISDIAQLSHRVQVDIDVTRYQMNVVSFLRMHRAVADGISPAATKHLGRLMRCLATLHGLDYVTPAMVGLAAKKVYMHRIRTASPENERSMQWGSTLEAVTALLDGVGPEQVVDDVLGMVTAPV